MYEYIYIYVCVYNSRMNRRRSWNRFLKATSWISSVINQLILHHANNHQTPEIDFKSIIADQTKTLDNIKIII